jgi:GDP-4-dehydro-6-deoxy-D-mannose reductase
MPRRILITGGSGFVGQWLSRFLLEADWIVYSGTIEGPPSRGVLTEDERRAICWTALDVSSDDSVQRGLDSSAPECVVHLAGIAFPPEANASPVRAFDVNALGALRLLKTLTEARSNVRVLVVGSAEQYGAHPAAAGSLTESAAQRPHSVYAVSKAAQELIALQAFRGSGLPVICTRSFNHSGPGHPPTYLLPSLVDRARPLPKTGGTLPMGNVAPVRDYLHVKDVVAAYALLLERGTPGEVYNVSSGSGVSVGDIARHVLDRLGVAATVVTDPSLVRPSDIPVLVGDSSKLRAATGWKPAHTLDDIIDDLIHAATH